jgi:3-deoxy-D-manno-octulosonate 8-phosphate phosphatase (KDO 8-P phosphatase)
MSLKLIVFDIDGCMTNGDVSYDSTDKEIKTFNVKDGLAIVSLKKLCIKTAIITGRNSIIVEHRAKELGIDFVYQGVKKKIDKLKIILKQENIRFSETAYIGDDVNDVSILKKVGFSFAPNDAMFYAKDAAKVILSKKGGKGAVREMIEILLKENDLAERFVKLWE